MSNQQNLKIRIPGNANNNNNMMSKPNNLRVQAQAQAVTPHVAKKPLEFVMNGKFSTLSSASIPEFGAAAKWASLYIQITNLQRRAHGQKLGNKPAENAKIDENLKILLKVAEGDANQEVTRQWKNSKIYVTKFKAAAKGHFFGTLNEFAEMRKRIFEEVFGKDTYDKYHEKNGKPNIKWVMYGFPIQFRCCEEPYYNYLTEAEKAKCDKSTLVREYPDTVPEELTAEIKKAFFEKLQAHYMSQQGGRRSTRRSPKYKKRNTRRK